MMLPDPGFGEAKLVLFGGQAREVPGRQQSEAEETLHAVFI